MQNRKGKWSEEETRILDNIVSEHIKMGATKAAAFKKAANVLGRTAGACSYRWNTLLRNKEKTTPQTFSQLLQLPPPKEYDQLNLDLVIEYLQKLKENPLESDFEENRQLLQEQEQLKNKNAALEKSFSEKKKKYKQLLEQYEAFTRIFNDQQLLH